MEGVGGLGGWRFGGFWGAGEETYMFERGMLRDTCSCLDRSPGHAWSLHQMKEWRGEGGCGGGRLACVKMSTRVHGRGGEVEGISWLDEKACGTWAESLLLCKSLGHRKGFSSRVRLYIYI